MKQRLLVVIIATVLLLTACTQKTALRFSNKTECGTATIALTKIESGNIKEYTVEQDKEVEIELDPNEEYSYEVTYPRQPDFKVCDPKRVTTILSKGQTLNIRLESVLAPELAETLTPSAPE